MESGDRVHVSYVRGQGVPEVRGRAAESSRPHGGQTEGGDFQSDGGGRPERPGGNVDLDKVRQVWGGEVMDGFEGMEKDLVVDAVFDWKPVELV